MKILVVGATGKVGRHVVAGLVEKNVTVRALSRAAERAVESLPPGVEIKEGDLANPADVRAALAGIDRVYLATDSSAEQVSLETHFIDVAQEMGVDRLVKLSAVGARPDHFVVLAQGHAAIEQHLAQSGVPAVILRPNWFMQNFLGSAETIAGQGAIYGSAAEGRVAFVDARDIAAVAGQALTGEGHIGRTYLVTGSEALTFAEAADRIGRGIGRPVTYVNLSDEDLRNALTQAGLPEEMIAVVLQINRNAREGNLAETTTIVADLTGRPARSLETFARDYAAMFAQTPV